MLKEANDTKTMHTVATSLAIHVNQSNAHNAGKMPASEQLTVIHCRWHQSSVSLKADRTTAHDRTVRRPRLHAVNSCAVVLVVRPHDRKQSTGVQS